MDLNIKADESLQPVSKELWYSAQKAMSERINEVRNDVQKAESNLQKSLDRIEAQTTKTNGRVSSLERSRVQFWTAISLLMLFGGAIIYLSIMAIDTKIREGISSAINEQGVDVGDLKELLK